MKNFTVLSLIILTFAFSAFAQKSKTVVKIDPTKQVHEAFDRLVEGIKQADADKVMSVYDNSEKLLFFNNNGSATQGWTEIKRQRVEAYGKITNVTLDITGLRIEMLGAGGAYLTCKWKQTQENSGKLENASGRMTIVFKLIGKDWKAVHLHTSPDNPSPSRPVFPSEMPTNQKLNDILSL